MMIDDIGPTKPAAGVIATKPATAPLATPRTVGLPRADHSANIQASAAEAAAVLVATKALAAKPLAPRALPALKPNQPTHSIAAPRTENAKLCGGIGSCGYPRRLPITKAATRAETPELICTTVPPAKSRAPHPRMNPPTAHTQWHSGSYRSVA